MDRARLESIMPPLHSQIAKYQMHLLPCLGRKPLLARMQLNAPKYSRDIGVILGVLLLLKLWAVSC